MIPEDEIKGGRNILKINNKTKRGGSRPGAGRKPDITQFERVAAIRRVMELEGYPQQDVIEMLAIQLLDSDLVRSIYRFPETQGRDRLQENYGEYKAGTLEAAPYGGELLRQKENPDQDPTGDEALRRLSYDQDPEGRTADNAEVNEEPTRSQTGTEPAQPRYDSDRASDIIDFRLLRSRLARQMSRHHVTAEGIAAQRLSHVLHVLKQQACHCRQHPGEHYHCVHCGRPVVPGEFSVHVRWSRDYLECSDASSLELDPDTGEVLREPDEEEIVHLWEVCVGSKLFDGPTVVCSECARVSRRSQPSC